MHEYVLELKGEGEHQYVIANIQKRGRYSLLKGGTGRFANLYTVLLHCSGERATLSPPLDLSYRIEQNAYDSESKLISEKATR